MTRKQLRVTVNGKAYDVEIEDVTSTSANVNVNGKSYSISKDAGQASPVVETRADVAAPAAPPQASAAPAKVQPQAGAAASSANDVRAPMPGVVLEVVVKVGDKVSTGQQLCALDAMKMKNAIRSPRDAVIASVEVANGQKVAYNDVLVSFE